MNDDPGIIDPDRWSRPVQGVALAALLVVFGAAVQLSLATAAPSGSVAIWLGNGLQIGVILLLARRWWPALLGACTGASVVLMLNAGASPVMAAGASAANLVVVLTAAGPLARERAWVEDRSNAFDGWVGFGLWGLVFAPVAGAALGVAVTVVAGDIPITSETAWTVGSAWYLADAVGICLVVPLALRLRRPALLEAWHRHRPIEGLVLLAVVAVVSVVVFASSSVGAIYLVVPVLLVVLFRYSFVGLTVGMAVVAAAVLSFTQFDEGPFASFAGSGALVSAQLFLLVLFATLVLVGALDEANRRHALMEEINDEAYELLATASGATIFVADATGSVRYVSNNVAGLLGIFDSQLLGNAWVDHVHPEDLPTLRTDGARRVRRGRDPVVRLRRHDGSWCWVEVTVRRSERRDRRGADVLVGMLRDVDARVRHELDLRDDNLRLAQEATTDPLTGLANRRRFAEAGELAWRQAIEARLPVSLLVVDVDLFKAFNDRYGHGCGDDCLRQIAEALTGSVRYPADLVARYGGEEFVILLPCTDKADALAVAKRVRASVRARGIEHGDSPHGILTVSVGVGTVVPRLGDDFDRLFDATDAAMYRSKGHGRDRIEIGDLLTAAG